MEVGVMEIEGYILGPSTWGGKFWGADNLCWAKACSPCSQLAPLPPNEPMEIGVMEIEGYVLGPHSVGASFGVLTTSVGPRLAPLTPNLPPSLPMDQVGVAGNGHQMVCFWVPTTCGANFWGAPHFSWTKSPSPCSQLTPLTHNWLSGGRA